MVKMKEYPDNDEYERWMAHAKLTFKAIVNDRSSGSYNWACFKCQQATEYAVKGFLKDVGKDSSCHSVSMLLKKAEFDDDLINIAKQIDMYFVPTRDPDSWPDGVPNDFYTLDDVDEAIRISELIIGAIDERWNMLKTPSSPMKRN